jgi:hypothetical protein
VPLNNQHLAAAGGEYLSSAKTCRSSAHDETLD